MKDNASSELVHQILAQYWGYEKFRALQEDIVLSVVEKRQDTLALLPTGGGKSICFQVPAMAIEGLCIVVSPLIALMKDQVENLQKIGISAAALVSGMTFKEIELTLDACQYGKIKCLYLSPERLKSKDFLARVPYLKVGLLVVDEAHCISQWGYDFRPPYLEIAAFRALLAPDVPCIALTASATAQVADDICQRLNFKNKAVFRKSFSRPNLSYSAIETIDKEGKMLEILKNVPGTSVVYVRNRNSTALVAKWLKDRGISADFYHAGLSAKERSAKQEAWIKDQTRVIVATNAFGMGIDKPQVRSVIHLDLPDCLEAYYQEAGRAGRDGKKAYCVLLYQTADIDRLYANIEGQYPPMQQIVRTYEALANYFKLAVGSTQAEWRKFDLLDFTAKFQLDRLQTYYCLKKLDEWGLIGLAENFFAPASIFCEISNEQLYNYQLKNPAADPIIKAILRLYGGIIFTQFTRINEGEISKVAQKTIDQVYKVLEQMQQNNVLRYNQSKDGQQICFPTERHPPQFIKQFEKLLEERKRLATEKADAMRNFAQHRKLCKTRMICEYFNEETYLNCGTCDTCVGHKKSNTFALLTQTNAQAIIDLVNRKPQTLQTLIALFEQQGSKPVLDLVRTLLDNDELYYTSEGLLASRKQNIWHI